MRACPSKGCARSPGMSLRRAVFLDIFRQIRARIDIFTNLPIRSLDKLALQKRIDEIGIDPAKAS